MCYSSTSVQKRNGWNIFFTTHQLLLRITDNDMSFSCYYSLKLTVQHINVKWSHVALKLTCSRCIVKIIFHQFYLHPCFTQGRHNVKKWLGTHYGERRSASLMGDLGAVPPVGSRGKDPGQGVCSPPQKLTIIWQTVWKFIVIFLHLKCIFNTS